MKRVGVQRERPDIVKIQNGFDLKTLLSNDGVDFTVNYLDDEYSFEKDIDEPFKIDNHFFHNLADLDSEAPNYVTFSEVRDKLKDYAADGKIKKYIIREGKGSKPGDGVVFARYISYVENDTVPFDSSYSRSYDPEKFKLGAGVVYEGFEIALKSMMKDEVACFLVHPDLAFKKMGVPPRIPPNAHIFLQIHLVNFRNQKEESNESEDNVFIDKRSFNEIYKRVKAELLIGNDNFRTGLISSAANSFRKGERILHSCRLKSDDEEKKWKYMLLKVSLNLCVCYNHNSIKKPNLVCLVVRDLFETIPDNAINNAKLLFQYGKAKYNLNDYKNAEKYLMKALKLKGDDDEEILNHLDLVRIKKLQDQTFEDIDSHLSFRRVKEDPADNKKEDL